MGDEGDEGDEVEFSPLSSPAPLLPCFLFPKNLPTTRVCHWKSIARLFALGGQNLAVEINTGNFAA